MMKMKKEYLIKCNMSLVAHEEVGLMLQEISDGLTMNDSKINFTPYKARLWNEINKAMNSMEKGDSLNIQPEDILN